MELLHRLCLAILLFASVQKACTLLVYQDDSSSFGFNLKPSENSPDDFTSGTNLELFRILERLKGTDEQSFTSELELRSEQIDDESRSENSAGSSLSFRETGFDEILQYSELLFRETARYSDSEDTPGIWITISQGGLDYVKDVLVAQITQNVTPRRLPDVTKSTNVPFVGNVNAYFTNVTLIRAEVPDCTISFGKSGIALQGSEVRVGLTLDWNYTYSAGWFSTPISDRGGANIEVEDMQAGIAVDIQEHGGALNLIVLQCGSYIKDLDVQLDGESLWLYQWLIDELKEHICAKVEDQLTAQLQTGVQKLDSLLLELPQQVPVDDTSELNFTIVHAPIISPTSISIGVNGQFGSLISAGKIVKHVLKVPPGLLCSGDMKMVTIALSESVLNSAAAIYYNAGLLNWLVDKVPDQTFLNTSKWKYLIPQLYEQYPNKDMNLNFTVSSPPIVAVNLDGMEGIATAYMIIQVVDNSEILQVACISIAASVYGSTSLNGNNITGVVGLNDFSLDLEWSHVGNIHLKLAKVFIRTLVKDVLLPLLNLSLRRGFPLPVVPFMELKNADIKYGDGFILVCTDAQYTGFS